MVKIAVVILVIPLISCSLLWSQSTDLVLGLEPDVVYHSGQVVTVNENDDIVQAIAIKDGRIVGLGSDDRVLGLAGPKTLRVNLEGKTVLPGFYDSHVHLRTGQGPGVQDWTRVRTREGLLDALREHASHLGEDEWVRGVLRNEDWPEDKLPNRWDIDQMVPRHPVVLTRGAHMMVVNSMGLAKAEITKFTTEPRGGTIVRDEKGELTGWLKESPAWRLVWRVAPRPVPDQDTIRMNMRHQLEDLLKVGITSLNVAGVRPAQLSTVQEIYEAWGETLPRITLQVRLSPGYDQNDTLEEGVERSIQELRGLAIRTGFGNDRLKLGAIKMSIDGGFSGEAFWSSQPYPNRPDFTGLVRIPGEAFYPVAKEAHDRGWQLGIHAIGDAAVMMVVDVLERILEESPRENHRHYLHHVSVLPPGETLEKMARLNIGVSSQPNFINSLGPFAVNSLRDERLARNNPQSSLARYGIGLFYGSDAMPYDPLFGIWTAVTRTGHDGKIYGADEGVSVKDAIKSYTFGTAYWNFDDKQRGSLEFGKVADMVILSEDILTIDPDRIREIQVEKTIVGGTVLYSR